MIKYLSIFFPIFLIFSCIKQEERPNILFIMSDDHTAQAWGVYDGILDDYVKTPNIRRLAQEGCLLKQVFCTNSICVPSRASILTGQYSHRNGIYTLSEGLDPKTVHVAKRLQSSGYETAIIGKWHLKQQPAGFDYFNVLPGQGRYHNPLLKTDSNWMDGNQGGKVYSGFSADVIGDQSVHWLENRSGAKPFFLMCHFKSTHEPFDYPERYQDYLKDVELPEPGSLYDFSIPTNGRTFTGQKLDILGSRWENGSTGSYPGLPFSMAGLDSVQQRKKVYQKFVKDFIRSGAAIDDNIGKLLEYLDAADLSKNTVVIYTADQGYFLGEHGFFDKRMMYEEALRMPFVIKYPEEIKPGSTNDDMILNIDFPHLFLDYADAESISGMQGRSFRNNISGKTSSDWRKSMYYRYWLHQRQRPAHFGIRTENYKLIFYYGRPLGMPGSHPEITEPGWEFFDLSQDPQENHNAYHDSLYQDTIRALKQQLLKLKNEVGDSDEAYPIMKDILQHHWQ